MIALVLRDCEQQKSPVSVRTGDRYFGTTTATPDATPAAAPSPAGTLGERGLKYILAHYSVNAWRTLAPEVH
ncbi:hypothetical protein GCM10010230_25220 [Streptomyces narbonensis]|nr:hypothetical protein GCM10010230_25220 [Streptomyces narbonensis]